MEKSISTVYVTCQGCNQPFQAHVVNRLDEGGNPKWLYRENLCELCQLKRQHESINCDMPIYVPLTLGEGK